MPDVKVTDLAVATSMADADVLMMVDDPAGTPVSLQISLGDMMDGRRGYGAIVAVGSVVVLLATTTPQVVDAWTANGQSDGARAVADQANEKLVLTDGLWLMGWSASFAGAAARTYDLGVFVDGVEAVGSSLLVKPSGGSTPTSLSSTVPVNVTGGGTHDVDLRVAVDSSTGTFDMTDGVLWALYLGGSV